MQPVTFRFTEAEFAEVTRLANLRQMRLAESGEVGKDYRAGNYVASIWLPLGLCLLLAVVSMARGPAGEAQFPALMVVGMAAFYIGYYARHVEVERFFLRLGQAVFNESQARDGDVTIALAADGVTASTQLMRAAYPFAAFTEVERTAGLVLCWMGTGTPLAVPERAFASAADLDAFCAAIAAGAPRV